MESRSAPAASANATLIGVSAILMWATLALLTRLSGPIPPFQLTGICFTLAFLIGVGLWVRQGQAPWVRLRLPWQVWLVGVSGLFGYHFFYFLALQNAPTVEASLIAYLWPLLIVLFSALLPGETLRWFHGAGAIAGFAGAILLISDGAALSFRPEYGFGYGCAVACAVIWSGYSILSRRFGEIPIDAVGAFCGVAAVLSWLCHGLLESFVMPTGQQALAIVGLGLGPVGAAFFTWDYGVKRGNIKMLGVLSYGAPLLSTLLLVGAGMATASWWLALACGLIVGGAALAMGDILRGGGGRSPS
ncbi:MAG: EamA family transporter [Kaiparowitsia implicata GSE-PSE-MK54-09C]|jgi:drug/metabolite transporter (DMT)-like permease|nr:EamA family transporter [Kaiparowitsia implicata GSE-PSE-MK54-09C]